MVQPTKTRYVQMSMLFMFSPWATAFNGSLSVCEDPDIITVEASQQENFTHDMCVPTTSNTPQEYLLLINGTSIQVANSSKYALNYTRHSTQDGQGVLTLEINNITVNDFAKYQIKTATADKNESLFTINLVKSGCPRDWCSVEQGRCLLVIKKAFSCSEAKRICSSNNGTLYDGTFNYRSPHCSKMNKIIFNTHYGVECSKDVSDSQKDDKSNLTRNYNNLSYFACFVDFPSTSYNDNQVFEDIKYLWVGVVAVFVSLMLFQLIASRRLRKDRAPNRLGNSRRSREKFKSIFYWNSSLPADTQTAVTKDSIELLSVTEKIEPVEETQSCDKENDYDVIKQESKTNFSCRFLRTPDAVGRGNNTASTVNESGIYERISGRFNSQKSLETLNSSRTESVETVDKVNDDFQAETFSSTTVNTFGVHLNEFPLIKTSTCDTSNYIAVVNTGLTNELRVEETTTYPSVNNLDDFYSKSQISNVAGITQCPTSKSELNQLGGHVDSENDLPGSLHGVHGTWVSPIHDTDKPLSDHEVMIDAEAEEVYNRPESFNEDHDYGSLTRDMIESRRTLCWQRNTNVSVDFKSTGEHDTVGVDFEPGKHQDAVLSETHSLTRFAFSDDGTSSIPKNTDIENEDEYWIPDGYRGSVLTGDDLNQLSVIVQHDPHDINSQMVQ